MRRESYLYTASGDEVICQTCQRRCIIPEGCTGWCGTRINEGGTLYSLIYGAVSALSINPIEKKPVFHFLPGSRWLSLGSLGCNFRCPGCQNWEIAHWKEGKQFTEYLSPEELVLHAKRTGCAGLSFTFNEPTLWFEYTLESSKRAKEDGLFTNYVTNGFITGEALEMIAPFLDVYRVDLKGFTEETYRRIAHTEKVSGILDIIRQVKALGIHLEIVTNIIPGYNDREEELRSIAAWIGELDPATPWHVTRFHPQCELRHIPPTPIKVLERAQEIGAEEELRYVYIGNVPGHRGENTYCHNCGELLIERDIFDIKTNRISGGRCFNCNSVIPGRFRNR